ncbi:MAG TPA: SURF1 family protein [Candidatus Limnocylindria bacterium]|nr:SURF1 family protein [Candidatus Limnocylindria bacterium]
MKLGSLLVLLAVLIGAAVCVRLGFWQLSRWREKQRLNAELAARLEGPTLGIRLTSAAVDPPRGRVEARGRYDESRQILLGNRVRNGAPGVEVVTPLLVDSTTAILVNRGWLYAPDAATARPDQYPEPGERGVIGIAEPLRQGIGGPALRVLELDSITLWSARWLDRDSLATRLPYRLAPFAIRQLPGSGVADRPSRSRPARYNESMHLSYAVQWFLFAAILVGGTAILAWTRRATRTVPS